MNPFHPDRIDDPAAYAALSATEQACVQGWITAHCRPRTYGVAARTSYGMKHDFTDDTGLYLTNGQMKGAMLAAGYKPYQPESHKNWRFYQFYHRQAITPTA